MKLYVQALEDVDLRAREGLGGDQRGATEGSVLSLSLIPYAVDVPDGVSITSSNQVNIDPNVTIAAGANNKALMHVLPISSATAFNCEK